MKKYFFPLYRRSDPTANREQVIFTKQRLEEGKKNERKVALAATTENNKVQVFSRLK
jgi:hypothetical protein